MFIERRQLTHQLSGLLNSFRAVELVGPRQVGKTTLARQFIDVASPQYFDLEDPLSRQRLADPMSTLAGLNGLVVIDEIQHLPALPETLRVLMDRPDRMHRNGQYLLLGSAAPRVMHKSERCSAVRPRWKLAASISAKPAPTGRRCSNSGCAVASRPPISPRTTP